MIATPTGTIGKMRGILNGRASSRANYAVLVATFLAGIMVGSFVLQSPRQNVDHTLQTAPVLAQEEDDSPPPCDRSSSSSSSRAATSPGAVGGWRDALGGKQIKPSAGRKSKLADGCWGVYLDVGSNIGVQVRKLFEGERYPEALVRPYFERHFGSHSERRQPGRVCAFGFEANPTRVKRLRALESCYNSLGWRVQFITPRAVLNSDDETIELLLDDSSLNDGQHLAASMFENVWTNKSDVHKVATMHLGKFIMEEIAGRLLPAGYTEPGPVFAKIDIEGAEYQTFGGLITSGALCEVQEASVEFHPSFIPAGKRKDTFFALQRMVENLAKMPECYTGCKTMKMNALDDETYLRDGMSPPDKCAPF